MNCYVFITLESDIYIYITIYAIVCDEIARTIWWKREKKWSPNTLFSLP